MNLFSVNQVNHVYVANALKTGSNEVAAKGDIKVKVPLMARVYSSIILVQVAKLLLT